MTNIKENEYAKMKRIEAENDDTLWGAFKERKIERRERKHKRLDEFDSTGWIKHSDVHFAKVINKSKLDYWPSTTRYRYKGKTYFNRQKPVMKFIEELQKKG